MGMYFTIADNIDCAFRKKKFAILDDDMDQLIFKNKDAFGSSVDVFIDLDPYGDKIFTYDEIELLLVASEALLQNDIIDYLDSKGEFKNYDGFSKVENKSLRIVFSIIAAVIMLILLILPYFLV